MNKIRAKAPLRLGIAGGGTDVSPYSDEHGGCVLNACINMYAHTFLSESLTKNLEFIAEDLSINENIKLSSEINIEGRLPLHRATYKKVMDEYNNGVYIPLRVVTHSDAPPGSGLGSSSTMVVSMLTAYRELLSLPLGDYLVASRINMLQLLEVSILWSFITMIG